MNVRALLHTLAELCQTIAIGSVVIPGLTDDQTKLVVAIAGLIGIAINRYMALTTQGAAKPPELNKVQVPLVEHEAAA